MLAAADPAQPYGAVLPWPKRAGARAARVAGAHVVLLGGRPALFVERGGRSMVPLRGPDREWLRVALAALVDHARRFGRKRLAVERFDGEPVVESESCRSSSRLASSRVRVAPCCARSSTAAPPCSGSTPRQSGGRRRAPRGARAPARCTSRPAVYPASRESSSRSSGPRQSRTTSMISSSESPRSRSRCRSASSIAVASSRPARRDPSRPGRPRRGRPRSGRSRSEDGLAEPLDQHLAVCERAVARAQPPGGGERDQLVAAEIHVRLDRGESSPQAA